MPFVAFRAADALQFFRFEIRTITSEICGSRFDYPRFVFILKAMDNGEGILICVPVEGTPPIYGSIHAVCTGCETPIWVSVSGQKAIGAGNQLKPFCLACAFERMKDETDLKPQIVPGAIDELKRHFGKVQNN